MRTFFIVVFFLLFVLLLPLAARAGDADIAEAEQYLRRTVIAAAAEHRKITFFADFLGATARAELKGADQKGVSADVMGMRLDVPWVNLSPRRFYGLAAKCAGDSAEARLNLARFALANGMNEQAESDLRAALELDPAIEPAVRPLLNIISPPEPAPAAPVSAPASTETRPQPGPRPPSGVYAPEIHGWAPTGLSGGGAMFTPTISGADPKVMMLNCDMSAAYVSTDGGRFWRMIHQGQLLTNTRCRPGLHPRDSSIMYAALGSRIKRSADTGLTWQDWGDAGAQLRGEIQFDHDNPSLMIAGTASGAVISHDAGKTWKPCSGVAGEGKSFHVDRTSPPERRVIFAATAQGVWRSDDSGSTWVDKTQGLPWQRVHSFAGGSDPKSSACILYCSVESRSVDGKFAGGIYRSRDRGESWQSAMGRGINLDTSTADEYAEGPLAQYKDVLTSDARPLTVYAANTSTGFHPPHHTTVYRSDDGGDNWRSVLFMDPRFSGYNVDKNYMTASTGQCYEGSQHAAAISPSNPDVVMRLTGQIMLTDNGGRTWYQGHCHLAPGQSAQPNCSWICTGAVVTSTWHYYVDPHQHNRHYIAYTDIGFARSMDGGMTWAWWEKNKWAPWRNTCYELAFDPEIPGRIWGAFTNVHDIPNDNIIGGRHWNNNPESGPGGVCVSTDFALSWSPSNQGMPVSPVTSVVVDPKSPRGRRTLYAGVFGKGVYKSVDDGKSWVNKSKGFGHPSNMRVYRVIIHEDGTLFAMITAFQRGGTFTGDGVGLYRSKDGAETWECITRDAPILWPKDFEVHPKNSSIIFIGAAATRSPSTPGGLYRTRDGGRTWNQVASKGRQHFGAYFHPKKPDWVYMTMCEGSVPCSLFLSTDGGDNWLPFNSFPFSNTQRVTVDPDDDNKIYVTTFGGSIFRGPAVPRR
ncbi:MAG: hypothetical protein JW909_13435 [Planctomycetes bacterium]|nr:hypothetical protein [Planctomycetota bacterium]